MDTHSALDVFHPATAAWFQASFDQPTEAQVRGWDSIADGHHTLIHAPTGSGKTLAAFLYTIDRLLHEPTPQATNRCRVLYISPLKALAYDIDRNLRAPLAGIRHAASRRGEPPLPDLTTFLRTGDTSAADRRRMQRQPPDILITTPESLYLLLTSQARETLRSVRWVIVDEVHAIAGSKRGAHLALSLERLEEITDQAPQRIGLSATQRPLETIGRFLGGGEIVDDTWQPRPVSIVDAPGDRPIEIELIVPVEDMAEPAPPDPLDPDVSRTRSIWPAVYPRVLELIERHQSTIVFANSRRLAERICSELNTLAGHEIARAHHGSVAREQRIQIEEALKSGTLPAVVATSSLELGIDMGAVDLVVQIEAPISVASGLQRVGRAGHQVGAVSRAKVFPKYRGDLLASTVLANQMLERAIEPTTIPRNPLDVLSQQLVAAVVIDDRTTDDLFAMARRAAPYAELSRPVFEGTLDMLAGRYPSDLFAELRPRVVWDRATGRVSARSGARQLAVANAGTIPDRGLFRVTLPEGGRVGELDEEMVYESRVGDVFVLGSSTWRITEIGPDRVEVIPAPGEPAAKMPFWHGDALGRSLETGRAIGKFIRTVGSAPEDDAVSTLRTDHHLDEFAARNLLAYLREERDAAGLLPTDQTLVVQRFRDEIGDWRLVLLSPLGARVHAPWAMASVQRLRDRFGHDVDMIWSDDGIAFRFPDADEVPDASEVLLDPDEVETLLMDHLADSAMFAARFREAAARALLLPRRRPGQRTPLWLQRRKAADLLKVAKQFGDFPIVLESFREILQDDFDLPALREVLGDIRGRKIRVAQVDTDGPSPFASSLLFAFVAAYLYEGDTPLAERRAAALTLDRELLRELLGEGELRELLDPDQLAGLELELQHLTAERRLRGPDGIHDLLRELGPLSSTDIDLRTTDVNVNDATEQLESERRIIRVRVGGQERWAAIEDAGRLRDALGIQPPPGVPHVFLEPVEDPLGDTLGRYARTHGPHTAEEVGTVLALPVAVVSDTYARLERAGRLSQGAFRPGGSGQEWIDNDVLRRLKRRSLAVLRSEIEPVPAERLAGFLPAWHQLQPEPPAGDAPFFEALRRLQGVELPASALERDILAARARNASEILDRAMVRGDVVWIGRAPLGTRDGKLSIYLRTSLTTLFTRPSSDLPSEPVHDAIRKHLRDRGASFFDALYGAAGGGAIEEVGDALWDLVWAGEVTNDTLAPVRAYLTAGRRRPSRRPRLAATFPPHLAGRWSLVEDLLVDTDDTVRATAWADQLLDRHGVVTRATVAAEGLPGGFTALYPVLSRMEETGRVRRGYFVEGMGGAQFALPGAVDRVRASTADGIHLLAATDPANPYGAVLDWPKEVAGRIGRLAGAYVVLIDGRLAAFLDGKRLLTFDLDADSFNPVASLIASAAGRHRRFSIETVNGESIGSTPWAAILGDHGFAPAVRGMTRRR